MLKSIFPKTQEMDGASERNRMEWEKLLSKERFYHSGDREESGRNDYDTIIRSTLFRRLQDKAQVFPLEADDYVRTRLTHSLEVSAIGKRLGELTFRRLKERRLDAWFEENPETEFSDTLLCAGLVHDIGNPPFGHFGEYAVREWFQRYLKDMELGGRSVTEVLEREMVTDLYCFEGNAQSLRLLSKTPHLGRQQGFNLTYRVLASIIKYPVSSFAMKNGSGSSQYGKFGYYVAERPLFLAVEEAVGTAGARHPLSYLLEAADDIAYRTSDLEDAMVKKILTFSQIAAVLEEYATGDGIMGDGRGEMTEAVLLLKQMYEEEIAHGDRKMGGAVVRNPKPELTAIQRWNRYVQEMMIGDAASSFEKNYDAIMNDTLEGDLLSGTPSGCLVEAISRLCEEVVYTSPVKIKAELFGRRVIDSLMGQFMPAAVKYDTGEAMTFIERRIMDTVSDFYKSMYHAQAAGKGEEERLYLRILMVTDYISGMTDNYARRLYRELFS